jgi:hypothetical protein
MRDAINKLITGIEVHYYCSIQYIITYTTIQPPEIGHV